MKSTYIYIGIGVVIAGALILWDPLGLSPNSGTHDEFISNINATSTTQTTQTTNTNVTTNNMLVTELKMEDEVVGTGATAVAGDKVTVQYVGTLMNGTIFDASRNHGDQGFMFTLGAGEVIKGWDMGVAGMKVGGKRKLTIPADLAYGNQAVGGVIPANSTLIFEVELIKTGK
ncbi:MAG: FKBP-type peptidyl-prolyl cis-trans isomerase [Candidatus Paceibacterota bacterium]